MNPIGISAERLLKRKKNVLFFKGIDAVDGTPPPDVKPCVPDFAAAAKVGTGRYKNKIKGKVICPDLVSAGG